jgi:hypothetical protein
LKNFPTRENRLIRGKVSGRRRNARVNNKQRRCSDAPGSQHARMNAGTSAGQLALEFRTDARYTKMPLLFYFPFIVWMGLMEIAQAEMRAPVRVKAQSPSQR